MREEESVEFGGWGQSKDNVLKIEECQRLLEQFQQI